MSIIPHIVLRFLFFFYLLSTNGIIFLSKNFFVALIATDHSDHWPRFLSVGRKMSFSHPRLAGLRPRSDIHLRNLALHPASKRATRLSVLGRASRGKDCSVYAWRNIKTNASCRARRPVHVKRTDPFSAF